MRRITRDALKGMMDKDVDFVLVDARSHEEFAKEHLPGAISMPSDHVGEHLLRGYGKERTFVTYCTDFECTASTVAAQKLERFGFTKVLEFEGGLADWKDAGCPTER